MRPNGLMFIQLPRAGWSAHCAVRRRKRCPTSLKIRSLSSQAVPKGLGWLRQSYSPRRGICLYHGPSPEGTRRGREGNRHQRCGTWDGRPVIILTFKGAKSGKIRKTPLMRIEHDGTYAVVASNGGAPTHPVWYRNIVANPLVELQDGAIKQEVRAREVFGEEKNEWWKRADAAWPDFPAYRARAGREIPVLLLEPLRRNNDG